jgi:hypothetical protein
MKGDRGKMFKRGDIVRFKWDGTLAKVIKVKDDKLMYVCPKEKFVKGGFSHTGITALISNYELVKEA